MTTIKTEGFKVPGGTPAQHRPHIHRPFSDGSMAVDTDVLASIEHFSSPFGFPQSLPSQPSIDQYMSSPHTTSAGTPHSFHSTFFTNFKMDNPEPPVSFPAAMQEIDERSRSLSASRSHVGKAPSNRAKPARKLSMSETRPPGPRGRPPHPHPRTMSHSDTFSHARLGLGIGLDTHQEGHRINSISPPGSHPNFGVSIPLDSSWTSAAPSLVPGSFGSYGLAEEAIMDSPVTPAQTLPNLPSEESYKKQRRRECHNQVEKRRREHINAKIEELSQLLPPNYNDVDEAIEDEEDEEGANSTKKKKKRSGSNAKQPKDTAHCKGRILSHSVQYIFDLKHITELQAARIQHLEALLASTGMAQPSFSWPTGPAMTPFNGIDGSHLATLPEHQLEVMRPSPESASPLPTPWHTGRADLMAYEPSPHSSASDNDFRRSSSLSTSESIEGDLRHVGLKLSPGEHASPIMEEFTSPHPARKLSDVELQMSMSGMDIDAMFGARREWQ